MPTMAFEPGDNVAVILPAASGAGAELSQNDLEIIQSLPALIKENKRQLERELGASLEVAAADPGHGARWFIGPARFNPGLAANSNRPRAAKPHIYINRSQKILITDAMTIGGVFETFSLLFSLSDLEDGVTEVGDCETVEQAVQLITKEVRRTFPSFDLRRLNWRDICKKHADLVCAAADPVFAMRCWLAELQDAHTWIRPRTPQGRLPYGVIVDGRSAVFTRVPENSPGWQLGLRPGFVLERVDIDKIWASTAATPHSKPLVAGRHLMSGCPGHARELFARGPLKNEIHWKEITGDLRAEPLVTWAALPSGSGYLRIRAWTRGCDMEESIDQAVKELRGAPGLVVDLRGNSGGDGMMAMRFRNRFVRDAGIVGHVRYRLPQGGLSDPDPILAEPAPANQRWQKPVRFLTDPLTYSASEDALLGLQGLDYVEVVGQPSGGGSGRMRLLPLLKNWQLSVSTALTYDIRGNCIEGGGIPVDRLIPFPQIWSEQSENEMVRQADCGW